MVDCERRWQGELLPGHWGFSDVVNLQESKMQTKIVGEKVLFFPQMMNERWIWER